MNTLKFMNVEVPNRGTAQATLDEHGAVVDSTINAPWVNFLASGKIDQALTSLAQEVAMMINADTAIKFRGLEAPLMVSAAIKKGQCSVWGRGGDRRIVVNPYEHNAWDADGDRALLVQFEIGAKKYGLVVKYPFTLSPEIMEVVSFHPYQERFMALPESAKVKILETQNPFQEGDIFATVKESLEGVVSTPLGIRERFFKSHQEVPVGLLTDAWNISELHRNNSVKAPNRLLNFYACQGRNLDIELGGMKAIRKDGTEMQSFPILEGALKVYEGLSRAFWKPGRISRADLVQTMINLTPRALNEHVKWLQKGHASIIQIEDDAKGSLLAEKTDLPKPVRGQNLLDNMEQLGLIKMWPKEINGVTHWVTALLNPEGLPVALTDLKRNGMKEGLSFFFVIGPVFNALAGEFQDGKEYLREVLNEIDNQKVDQFGSAVGFWPESEWDFKSPNRVYLIQRIQRELLEMLGQVGVAIPALKEGDNMPKIRKHNVEYLAKSILIDYGQERTGLQDMWTIWQVANSQKRLCPESKSTNRRWKRYALANDQGEPLWGTRTSHPGRRAKQISQLVRAEKMQEYTCLVLGSQACQAWATPSGAAKQAVDNPYSPRVITSMEEYTKILQKAQANLEELKEKAANVAPPAEAKSKVTSLAELRQLTEISRLTYIQEIEEAEKILQALEEGAGGHECTNWTGKRVIYWTIPARAHAHLGKLVSEEGDKLQLAFWPQQIETTEGEEIDLILPVEEMLAKANVCTHLAEAKQVRVKVGNKMITGQLVKIKFARSGAASENIPARSRTSRIMGGDRLWALKACQLVHNMCQKAKVDTPEQFAKTLEGREISEETKALHLVLHKMNFFLENGGEPEALAKGMQEALS